MEIFQKQFQRFIDSIPLSHPHPCSYIPGQSSQVTAFIYREKLPPLLLEYIINQGFRRYGDIYYQNHCPHCKLCLSYRIPLKRFELTKSQKRLLRRHQDLKVSFSRPYINKEKEQLYLHYQYVQHFLKPSAVKKNEVFDEEKTLAVMYEQMYKNVENSIEMTVFLGDYIVGFAVFDAAVDSVSAVYSVYNPEEKNRSIGTFMIIQSIQWAHKLSYPYYHLGFFLPGHPKMDYKSRFYPAEIMNPETGLWEDSKKFMAAFESKCAPVNSLILPKNAKDGSHPSETPKSS